MAKYIERQPDATRRDDPAGPAVIIRFSRRATWRMWVGLQLVKFGLRLAGLRPIVKRVDE